MITTNRSSKNATEMAETIPEKDDVVTILVGQASMLTNDGLQFHVVFVRGFRTSRTAWGVGRVHVQNNSSGYGAFQIEFAEQETVEFAWVHPRCFWCTTTDGRAP